MRRRQMLASTPFVVALALMLPASTLAVGAYTYSVKKNYCTNYPAVVFKVRLAADGTTNANKLTINSKGQSGSPGNWVTYKTWPRVTAKFSAGSIGTLALKRTYYGDAFASNRIVFVLKAWHNSTLKWKTKVHSTIC